MTSFMGPEYGRPGNTWASGAEERYDREHGIDPRTGGVTGPLGPVPAGIGLKWQAAHDQAVWNARYRMGQEALRYSQSAAGLLSSFRRGGGAALESNIYGQQAGIQLQRAQMLQPLDLLGDYRRDVVARSKGAGRTESTIGAVLQGVGAIVSIAQPQIGGVIGAVGGAVSGVGARKQAGSIAAASAAAGASGGGYFGGGGQAASQGDGGIAAWANIARSAGRGAGQGQPSSGEGPLSFYQGNTPFERAPDGGGGRSGGGGPGAGMEQMSAQSQLQGEQAQQRGQGGQQSAGGQAAAGPGAIVGGDGRFDPLAYAQYAANTAPVPEPMQVALSESLAYQIHDDPGWSMISMRIDQELMLRMQRGAA